MVTRGKYFIDDIVFHSSYNQYGWIWNIKENCYVIKWLGRACLDDKMWGAYHNIYETDVDINIRKASKTEAILYGPKNQF